METQAVGDRIGSLLSARVNGTLWPFLFRKLRDYSDSGSLFIENPLQTGLVMCRFSAVLLQASWYSMHARRQANIPGSLEDLLRQIWAGHQCIDDNMPLSILQEAILDSDNQTFRKTVTNLPVLVKWNSLIAARQRRYKEFDRLIQGTDWVEMIRELLQALPVLHNTTFDSDEQSFLIGKDRVRAFPFVQFSPESDNPLYLYRFEGPDSPHTRILFEDPFSDYEEEYPLISDRASREYIEQMRIILGVESVPEGLVQLFGSGYAHIKNVAYAIANTDSKIAKTALMKLKEAHPEALQEVATAEEGMDARLIDENFAVLLLAEQGPARIVSWILGRFGSVEGDYLEYLQLKRSVPVSALEWDRRVNATIALRKKSIEKHLALDDEMKQKVINQIEIDTKTWAVLSAAGMQLDAPRKYVESIGMRIALLRSWLMKLQNSPEFKADAVLNANKLIERTCRFLICFYGGVEAYYEDTKQNPGDAESHEAAFVQKAAEIHVKCERDSAGILLGKFRNVAEGLRAEVCDMMLGRKAVCNLQIYKTLSEDFIKVLNNLKHDKGVPCGYKDAHKFLERTMQLFEFFRTNEDLAANSPDYSLTPVYPSIISFREAIRKRDGLLIYHYEVRSLKDERDQHDIRVLTPLQFSSDEEYYCIPVFNRATRRWWLEPFLLKTSSLDCLFDEEGSLK